jgi:hypothetical protein
MKEIEKVRIALGFHIFPNNELNIKNIDYLSQYNQYLYDIHISHYDNKIVSSGRCIQDNIKNQEFFIIEYAISKGITVSLLMNYLLHKDYDLIIKNFKENFYSRGIRNVVIADLELIKRMKQALPDVHIQGSCLSYRMTEDELYEEAKEGVEIHNPAVDIIRDYKQLIANHKAGFKQKIIFAEGCLHKCPFERVEKGHRWHIARSLMWNNSQSCATFIKKDFRLFYRANWITIERLKELSDYIEVFKLPRARSTNFNNIANSINTDNSFYFLELFLNAYKNNNVNYNILDFNCVIYNIMMRQKYRMIPSRYFDKDFFDTIGYCNMECDKLGCRKCYSIQKRIDRNYTR